MISSKVLVLNKNWTAIGVSSLQKVMALLYSEYSDGEPKANIITPPPKGSYELWTWKDWSQLRPVDGEKGLVSSSAIYKIPEVILLTRYDSVPSQKVNFCRRAIWKRDEFKCFTPETLILMGDFSLKPINEISVGDEVIDAYGNIEKVEYVHSRPAVKNEIISIKHRGNGETLNCTKDHKIIKFNWDSGLVKKNGFPAGDLTTVDYVAELVPQLFEQDSKKIDLYNFCKDRLKFINLKKNKIKHYSGRVHSRYIKIDKNLGKLCGYYLSEGCVVKNSVRFALHSKEKHYAKDIKTLLKKIFGVESSWRLDGNKGCVICCSSIISLFFSEFFGTKDNKRIGIKTNKKFLQGVLYGIVRGDAYFNNKQSRCTIMMSRPKLIREIYLVSLALGFCPSLSKTCSRKDGRIYKSINFNAEDYNKISRLCCVPYVKWKPSKNNKKDRKIIKNHLISKITEIKEIQYEGLVYDLQISGSHTYVANFLCVHNCQYCGIKPNYDESTLDHIIPKSKGGETTWLNCVLACYQCNSQKADRQPHEAYKPKDREKAKLWRGPSPMKLLKEPKKPEFSIFRGTDRIKVLDTWKHWVDKFYWDITLDNDMDEDDLDLNI